MEPVLDLQVLGGVDVRRQDGTAVDNWVRPTGRRLLCLVLLSPGRTVTRTHAAQVLFPDGGARRSNELAKAVHWCRRALGPALAPSLRSDDGVLRWQGAARADADAVLHVARSGTVPEGISRLRDIASDARELLPGWDEDWVDEMRAEVARGRSRARSDLAARLAQGDGGDLASAVELWQSLVGADPLDESHQLGLMRALLALGRFDEARVAWLTCRRVLWTELGAEPGAALEDLWRSRGVASDDGREEPRRLALHEGGTLRVGVAGPASVRSRALVGRDEEVRRLVGSLEGAETGRGSSATLIGPAGSGKTSIVQEVASHLRARGWKVVEARGARRGGGTYRTALALLRDVIAESERAGVEKLLGDRDLSMTPVTQQGRIEDARHASVISAVDRSVLIPTLFVIDDAHEADAESARLVRDMAVGAEPRWWSLALTTRSARVVSVGDLVSIGPLDDLSLRSIVRNRRPRIAEGHVDAIVSRADGNPLFALELAALPEEQSGDGGVPPSVIELLRTRLSRLPAAERHLMPLVVVAGGDATWPVLSQASRCLLPDGPTDVRLLRAADVLLDQDLVRRQGDLLLPSHPLMGEAAMTMLGRTAKAALHDAVGEALTLVRPHAETLVHHRVAAFELTPDADHAAAASLAALTAARTALSQGRDDDAAEMARCVERGWLAAEPSDRERMAPQRSEAHLILGHALARVSVVQASAAYAIGFAAAADDDLRARFRLADGWLHYMHGDLARAAAAYQSGLAQTTLQSDTRALLLTHLGWVFARQGLQQRALALTDTALELLDRATADPMVLGTALDRRAMILAFLGRVLEAKGVADHALEVATVANDTALLSAVQAHRGAIRGRLGDWEQALRCVDEAVALATSIGDAYVESVAWWTRTDILTRQGDLEAALHANHQEERALRLFGNEIHLSACRRRRRRLEGKDAPIPHSGSGPTP